MKTRVNKKNKSITLGILLALTGATVARADETTSPQYAFDLTPSSDYIFRGVSQTENDPALFAWSRVSYDDF